ncbi:DUF956 family protein [Olsenella sp. HMSC062G07]|uniref:DUF956 family protein n=1 Tax=Olsenella sp. HMSC062G07 TaxID=1739330 RepID=UPI0008A172B7|nr:DUF956 family protein [Olsenella sp. HMSC062G07]OFK24849.1 hypothetical protein HMPREF2826_06425 [Olsenella sp. HMSC062G07]
MTSWSRGARPARPRPLDENVDLTIKAQSYLGLGSYGTISLGSHGIEYQSDANEQDYVQIPWGEVTRVSAPVMLKGRYLPRFTVHTRRDGSLAFSTRDNKRVLRAMRPYVGDDALVRETSLRSSVGTLLRGLLRNLPRSAR